MLRFTRLLQSKFYPSVCCSNQIAQQHVFSQGIRNMSTDTVISEENERMDYDVVIVGGGCAGLSAAIRLKREAVAKNLDLSVCILEKSESLGSHILSGCLLDTSSLSKLIPDWKDRESPITQQVSKESMQFFINKNTNYLIPSMLIPRPAKHSSSYIVSLSNVCRWLGSIAEEEGIDIFTDISASQLIKQNNRVVGVLSSDKGVDRSGRPKEDYQKGYAFYSKYLILAEGSLGSLTEQVIQDYHLQSDHQRSYGLGIKEIWEIPAEECHPGSIIHTVGYPLQRSLFDSVYGGGFIYYEQPNLLHIGLITGLDYQNTYISPYEEFQLYKKTRFVSSLLANAQRVEYGARVIYEGGLLGQCKPVFPGGCIVGDSLGVVNMATLQGTGNAIESGILLADSLLQNWKEQNESAYQTALENSALTKQLQRSRSLRGVYEHGLLAGMAYAFVAGTLLGNHNPLTHALSKGEDWEKTETKEKSSKYNSRGYEKPDDKLTFSRESSLAFSSISYPQDSLPHITVKDDEKNVPVEVSKKLYDAPEERFCPAHVYEFIKDNDGNDKLQINSENCLHCKTCVIKLPRQYAEWKAPSSGGPNYSNM